MDTWRVMIGDTEEDALAADALGVGLALTAADGRILRANAPLRTLLGEGMPDGPDALTGLLLAAGVAEPGARLDASRDASQDLVLCRGGRGVPVRLTSSVLPSGDVLHLFHELNDAAESRARQAELQSLIAHDLRSPLAVIQGYAGLLATGQPGPLNATQSEFLAGIDTKIIEVTRLLDDFLDLTRLEAGALELQMQAVALDEVVDQVCREQSRSAAARGITVRACVDPADLVLVADPLRLKQVVENLVGNAVKYNGDGGWVEISGRRDQADAIIAVADGGPGMDAAELAAVFEPFTRGRAGSGVAGSGLGLVVVQRLVALHGGSMDAASSPGSGTVFTVRWPLGSALGDAVDSCGAAVQ